MWTVATQRTIYRRLYGCLAPGHAAMRPSKTCPLHIMAQIPIGIAFDCALRHDTEIDIHSTQQTVLVPHHSSHVDAMPLI